MNKNLSVIVLAGGTATRMRPLSVDRSKTMLPFLGRPLLEYLFEDLRSAGLTRLFLTSRGRGGDVHRHFDNGSSLGLTLEYLEPREWTGTAGLIKSLLDEIQSLSDPFIVIYGDSLLRMNFQALLDFHNSNTASMTIACHRPQFDAFLFESEEVGPKRTNFGIAQVEPDGSITRFEEKPTLERIQAVFTRPMANAAVYVMSREPMEATPRDGSQDLDFGYDVIPQMISRNERVFGMDITPGFRVDLGTLSHYLSFQLATLRGEVPWDIWSAQQSSGVFMHDTVAINPGATLIPPLFLDAGVSVAEDVVLESAIIGKNVVIQAGTTVRESIILDGSTVEGRASIQGSIVGGNCRVVSGTMVPRGTVIGSFSRIGGENLILPRDSIQSLLRSDT